MPPAPRPQHFFPGEELPDDEIRVTLLGTGTPFPRRGQACACMFVEAGSEKFLLDCGPGAPANFTSLEVPFPLVTKIFFTHHHVDHIGGLDHFWIGGWTYGRKDALRVWGPPGTADIVEHFKKIYAWDIETRIAALPKGGHEIACTEYGNGVIYDANGVKITAFEVIHTPPHNTYGLRIDYRNRSFVFSGDTKYCEALVKQARGVDLLVHESFPPAALYATKSGRTLAIAKKIAEEFHTSPREAGHVFADANPRLGVLYHLYNNDDVVPPVVDEVRERYKGRFEVGYDLMVINIGDEILVRPAIVGDKPWPIGKTV